MSLIHIRIKGEFGTVKHVCSASFVDLFYYVFNSSLLCCLVYSLQPCWERADLLALLCVTFSCVFVTFPYAISGQVWYLIELIPDLCLILYIVIRQIIPNLPLLLTMLSSLTWVIFYPIALRKGKTLWSFDLFCQRGLGLKSVNY